LPHGPMAVACAPHYAEVRTPCGCDHGAAAAPSPIVDMSEKVGEWFRHILCLPDTPTPPDLEQVNIVHAWADPHNLGLKRRQISPFLPVGSLKVGVERNPGTKLILPEEARQLLRSIPRPQQNRLPTKGQDAEETLRELGVLRRSCQLAGHLFMDISFRISTGSKVAAVLRPSQIARHEGLPPSMDWRLFRGRPRADDVQQGELGDCWFLSSLAALAEFQEGRLLHALLPGQNSVSDVGAYIVRLCLGGRWRSILVDDHFPCIGGGMYYTQLAYCVTKRQQLWASLIEKAFAKACGSYEAIRGGEASEALEMLTGWPCTMVVLGRPGFDPEMLWATLCSSRDAAFLMTCSTKSVHSRSLERDHVYSLLDVHEVADSKGEIVRLLKIRNPHARSKWEGEWSDSSARWTPELRMRLGCPEGGSPQVFFMAFDDFIREFAHCTICRICSSEWHEAREPVHLPGSGMAPCAGVEVEASEITECCISLVQPSMRLRGGPFHPQQSGPLACMGFVLLPLDSGGKLSICASAVAQFRHAATVSADCWLQAGRHLLVPLSVHQGPSLEATWAFVSSRRVSLKERPLDAQTLKHAWAAYARDRDPEGIPFHGATLRLGKSDAGAVVACAENPTERYLQLQLSFRSQCMRYSRGLAEVSDWLPPHSGKILQVAEPHGSEEKVVTWHQSHTFRMTDQAPETPWHSPALQGGSLDLHRPFQRTRGTTDDSWCTQQ